MPNGNHDDQDEAEIRDAVRGSLRRIDEQDGRTELSPAERKRRDRIIAGRPPFTD